VAIINLFTHEYLSIQMDESLYHKFTQHNDLRAELLATGDAELVEVGHSRCYDPSTEMDYIGFRQGLFLGYRG